MSSSEYEDDYDAWMAGASDKLESALYEKPLSELEYASAVLLEADVSIRDAIALMDSKKRGSLLVGSESRLEGIFTERDIIRKVMTAGLDFDKTVLGDVMTRNPETLQADSRIVNALRLMSVGGYRHVPVVNEHGNAVGMVSVRHIVDFIVHLFPNEVFNAPPQSMKISSDHQSGG